MLMAAGCLVQERLIRGMVYDSITGLEMVDSNFNSVFLK